MKSDERVFQCCSLLQPCTCAQAHGHVHAHVLGLCTSFYKQCFHSRIYQCFGRNCFPLPFLEACSWVKWAPQKLLLQHAQPQCREAGSHHAPRSALLFPGPFCYDLTCSPCFQCSGCLATQCCAGTALNTTITPSCCMRCSPRCAWLAAGAGLGAGEPCGASVLGAQLRAELGFLTSTVNVFSSSEFIDKIICCLFSFFFFF